MKIHPNLHAFNASLSQCVESKNLKPIGLEQVSLQVFFRDFFPQFLSFKDNQDKNEIEPFTRHVEQLFVGKRNKPYFRIFNKIISLFRGEKPNLEPQDHLEVTTLNVSLKAEDRLAHLYGLEPQAENDKSKAARLQAALCCMQIEHRFLQSIRAEISRRGLSMTTTSMNVSNIENAVIFGRYLNYFASLATLRKVATVLFDKQDGSFLDQYRRSRANFDRVAQHFPHMPFPSSDAFISREWIIFNSTNNMLPPDEVIIALNEKVFSFVAPFGMWIRSEMLQKLAMSEKEELTFYTKVKPMNSLYYELRSQQEALYDLFAKTLRDLYNKSNRAFVKLLEDPVQPPKFLPDHLPVPIADAPPDLEKFLRSIPKPPKQQQSKPVIASYSAYVASMGVLPAEIPQQSDPFWKLASTAFTTAVDRFIHLSRKTEESTYLLPVTMSRRRQESKRGVVIFKLDQQNQCNYRLFVQMENEKILEWMARPIKNEELERVVEYDTQLDGNGELPKPDSLPWSLRDDSVTIHDNKLDMTIQVFPIRE